MPGKIFTYKHTVYFNETNALGGVVYYANYVKWQGMAREAFFIETVPEWRNVMAEVAKGNVNMLTAEEHSHFIQHAFFGDIITIKIYAVDIKRYSFKIIFEMYKDAAGALIYKGWQILAFDDFKGHFVSIPKPLLTSVLNHTPLDEIKKYERRYNLIGKEKEI